MLGKKFYLHLELAPGIIIIIIMMMISEIKLKNLNRTLGFYFF